MGKKKQRSGGVGTKDRAFAGTKSDAASTIHKSGSGSIGSLLTLLFGVPFCTLKLTVWCILSIPFWGGTFVLAPFCGGWPPVLVSGSQVGRFLTRYTWFHPRLSTSRKLFLTLAVLEHWVRSPMAAVCWMMDEVLYGKELDSINLGGETETADSSGNDNDNDDGIGMIFVVSGYRSASTHLARSLLEEQEKESSSSTASLSLVSPNSMMMSVPYLWIWKLVTWFVGDLTEEDDEKTAKHPKPTTTADEMPPNLHPKLSKSQVRTWYREKYSSECLERHDFDPFCIDTLDLSFLSCHLNGFAWEYCLDAQSSEVVLREFHYAKHTPENQRLYEVDFVRHIDRLARKTVLFHRNSSEALDTPNMNAVLFKGHFLSVVPALQHRYPTAKFVTVLRDPCDRLKSAINYTAVNPSISGSMDRTNANHWKILAATLAETEAEYCLQELQIFRDGGDDDSNRKDQFASIHYDALATPSRQTDTIRRLRDWLLGAKEGSLPGATTGKRSYSTKKAATGKKSKTKGYRVDKTLHELGIDETAYRTRLSEYTDFMNEIGRKKKIT